jgi:hypothetical protein
MLDLAPALRRKRAAQCKHPTVSVSDHEASATCDDCGAEIDPWLLLRQIANHWDKYQARVDTEIDTKLAEGNAKLSELNRRIAHNTAELNELIERKNRLWNTPINGRPLGTYRKTRARKQPSAEAPSSPDAAAHVGLGAPSAVADFSTSNEGRG